MILLCPVQNKVPGAQFVLLHNGHRAALAEQVFLHCLLPGFLTVCLSPGVPIPRERRSTPARYRLIQVCMVEWNGLPQPAAPPPASASVPQDTPGLDILFEHKSISIRFPIFAPTPSYYFAVCLLGSISVLNAAGSRSSFAKSIARRKSWQKRVLKSMRTWA